MRNRSVKVYFEREMKKLKRFLFRRTAYRFVLAGVLLFIGCHVIILIFEKTGMFSFERFPVYYYVVFFSLLFAGYYIYRTRKIFFDELLEIDKRFAFKERLTTAYEYVLLGKKSIYLEQLMGDVVGLLKGVEKRRMVPHVISRYQIVFFAVCIVVTGLFSIDYTRFTGISSDSKKSVHLSQTGNRLKDYIKKELEWKKNGDNETQDRYREKMKAAAKALEDKFRPRPDLLKSLQRLDREVEKKRVEDLRRLEKELNKTNPSGSSTIKQFKNNGVGQRGTRRLRKQVERLFRGQLPSDIENHISSLEQNEALDKLLDDTIRELSGFSKDISRKAPETKEQKEKDQSRDKQEESRKKGSEAEANRPGSESWQDGAEKGGSSRNRGSGEEGMEGSEDDESSSGEGGAGNAGSQKSKNKKKERSNLAGSEGQVFREDGISGQGEAYNAYVRSLSATGSKKIKEEEVIRNYSRRYESVLKKEDIPVNYKKYIKSYFISIGMGKGDKKNDDAE